MAVSLPSDLVADVIRSADPARRQAAARRLESFGEGESAFAAAIDQSAPLGAIQGGQEVALASEHGLSGTRHGMAVDQPKVFRSFEQVVLRSLFETLLPESESGAFGGGPSAGVWRSMAADQLAGVYAESGGIGIARMLASQASNSSPGREEQWPYFRLQPLKAFESEG